jgi:3-phenylpropionate/trans-cinnamate dioxygenase ferredoxin component
MLAAEKSKITLVKIAVRSELPACGTVKEFMAAGRMLCVANVDDNIYAMDNACLHWGGPLGQGAIKEGKIVCPWHGWQFDPRTGEGPPRCSGRLAIHKVTIEGEDVFVELQEQQAASVTESSDY